LGFLFGWFCFYFLGRSLVYFYSSSLSCCLH
jgi:hypothetical protein